MHGLSEENNSVQGYVARCRIESNENSIKSDGSLIVFINQLQNYVTQFIDNLYRSINLMLYL